MAFDRIVASFIRCVCSRGAGRFFVFWRADQFPSTTQDEIGFRQWASLVITAVGVCLGVQAIGLFGVDGAVLFAEETLSPPSQSHKAVSYTHLTLPTIYSV